MISQVARLIKEEKIVLPFSLYVVNAVQEEVGLHGAEMITQRIKPDLALITDVAHDTSTPLIEKKIEGETKIGLGPVIFAAPSIHNYFRKKIIHIAKENNIPFQRGACSRYSGTDTDAFAYSNGGVPSALISLPLRYMHTTVELVQKEDIEATISLLYLSLKSISSIDPFKDNF